MSIVISLLGPVGAKSDGVHVELGPPQQRAVLALLALRPGLAVESEAIIDALWPEDPPASAAKIVQTYVSRLRKLLGPDAIVRRGGGYALGLEPAVVDAVRFERQLASGAPADALTLWRGPALSGVDVPALRPDAQRLEELRRRAIEDVIAARVRDGDLGTAVAEARLLLADDPRRERAIEQLMLALYSAGRQADALEVYRDARRRFVDELGLEPGPSLKDLERRILAHDPALAPGEPATTTSSAIARRRRVAIAAAVIAAALLAVGAGAISDDGPAAPVVVKPHSLVRIDPRTNDIVEVIPVGREPAGILATRDAVWVANERDRTLSHLDLETRDMTTIGGVPAVAFLVRDERGNVYASAWDYPFVWRIDPRKLEVADRYRVRSRALGLAVGAGSLWVVDRLVNAVDRIDLREGRVIDVIPVGADPLVTAFGYGTLWVANSDAGSVSAIRAGVRTIEEIDGFPRPFGIAAGEGGVWVGSNADSSVRRIDPDTRRVIKEILVASDATLPSGLFDVAAGAGGVWAANRVDLNVVRIDPRTNSVAARIRLGFIPHDIDVTADAVWVSVGDRTDE